ncbi:MAG: hypothetical protein ABSA09_11280 [Desulfobaccales bacterium]|jgi:hypothetical protein
MGYTINCDACEQASWAGNIVELIENHTDDNQMFKCTNCGSSGAYIHKIYETQGNEDPWEPYFKGIIRIDYKEAELKDYHPYVFLIGHGGPQEKVNSLQISYYKDLRETGGSLKHGHGPGGAPVIGLSDFANILHKLIGIGVMPD